MSFEELPESRKVAIALTVAVLLFAAIFELFAWWFVDFRWHVTFPPFYSTRNASASTDPCEQWILDLQLGDIHDASAGCTARDSIFENGFVRYTHSTTPNPIVVATLGGSTTDGLIRYADGYTWPFWLSKLGSEGDGRGLLVLNGGSGGFSSSRELRKLQRDVLLHDPRPNVVISLNAINDTDDYDSQMELTIPYYIERQLRVINGGRISPSQSVLGGFLPNSLFLLDRLIDRGKRSMTAAIRGETVKPFELDPRFDKTLPRAKFKTKGELWKFNVSTMHAISRAIGANYLVFVQPTMGLKSENVARMSPNDRKLYGEIGPDYFAGINKTYDEIRMLCRGLNFCVDLSDLLKYDGIDLYHDPRHPNARGNRIIAERVLAELSSRGYRSTTP